MKHFLSIKDCNRGEILELIDLAGKVKENPEEFNSALKGMTLAMVFKKTSTRTRVSFESGMTQMGGHAIYMDWASTNFTLGEVKDEVKCIARYVDAIIARVYEQVEVEEMAEASAVPVINALSNQFHPCQILSDLFTIKEKFGKFEGLKIAYIGDGCNTCNSLIIGCSKLGIQITVATPKGYEPLDEAIRTGEKAGVLKLTNDIHEAVKGADIVYTDTWVSMGMEAEREQRLKDFRGYTLTKALAGSATIMHCLPAHRGYEISDDAIDSEQSIVFDQAENRLHAQKALLLKLLGKA